jgi:hypothetical protein
VAVPRAVRRAERVQSHRPHRRRPRRMRLYTGVRTGRGFRGDGVEGTMPRRWRLG